MATVKVAVRVRPFNRREINMGSKCIIEMDSNKTKIYHKTNNGKTSGSFKEFVFDYSYWSFDEDVSNYIAQEKVFQDLGTGVVDSAFEGYNACVFAYGQTGSGKTYTMMGTPDNQGLIPRICESLFNRMLSGSSYRVEVSYLEIYNEKVKDLLSADTGHNLRVREHPRLGPTVQDLSKHLVSEYSHIQALMSQGNSHRTTANTNMNDSSSRSHAIFTIMFVQAGISNNLPTETVSKIHLVDLAGSERADATGATGQRLKEGAHINKSLVTLGSVISALAELSSAQEGGSTHRNAFIPYRDSVLTWLLKDSLGGNSKTIMIAALSPADCNYSETLSTLRYANRAKNIINKPTINEDPNVKLIRELRAEISRLKGLISTEYPESHNQVLATLFKKEAEEKVLTERWAEKWKETQVILQEQEALALRKAGTGVVLDSERPHLICIDDNLLSTGVTLYHLKDGETLIGTEAASQKQHIVLTGIEMEPEHCSILLQDEKATLVPKPNAHCWVNGFLADKPTELFQGCIILVGRTNMFRYNDPVQAEKMRKEGDISPSHLNLSRMSLMTWSSSDLIQSSDLNTTCEIVPDKEDKRNGEICDGDNLQIPSIGTRECAQKQLEKDFALKHYKELIDKLSSGIISVEFLTQKVENKCDSSINNVIMDDIRNHKQNKLSPIDRELKINAEEVLEHEMKVKELESELTSIMPLICIDESSKGVSQHVIQIAEKNKLIESRKRSVHEDSIQPCSSVDTSNSVAELNMHTGLLNYEDVLGSPETNVGQNHCYESPLPTNYSLTHPLASSNYSYINQEETRGIYVGIQSFVLRGTGASTHYVYEVALQAGSDNWTILRRYSRFRELHLTMKEKYGTVVSSLVFPPRKLFFRLSEDIAKERKHLLEAYLQSLIQVCSQIKTCPLYSDNNTPSKQALVEFSPFFRRGIFETGKYATS